MLIYPIPTYVYFRLVRIQMFCISRPAFLHFTFHIFTVAIKNIRNIHAISTNQIADILHFNDNLLYGSEDFCFNTNKKMIKTTIKFLKTSERFIGPLF